MLTIAAHTISTARLTFDVEAAADEFGGIAYTARLVHPRKGYSLTRSKLVTSDTTMNDTYNLVSVARDVRELLVAAYAEVTQTSMRGLATVDAMGDEIATQVGAAIVQGCIDGLVPRTCVLEDGKFGAALAYLAQ